MEGTERQERRVTLLKKVEGNEGKVEEQQKNELMGEERKRIVVIRERQIKEVIREREGR